MCYQWQVIVYNALKPVVEGTKYFKIARVGKVTESWYGGTKLAHNWVAIGVTPLFGQTFEGTPSNEATVYLDPYMGGGTPKAYCYVGGQWEDGHDPHNWLADKYLGDPKRPTGVSGRYKKPNGEIDFPDYINKWSWPNR